MFGLCRKWRLSLPASVFGALALTYSESWIGMTYNACFYQTMAWIPFTLMAMECWWEKPSLGNVVFFAVSFSQVILGGYQPAVHGLLFFIIVVVLTRGLPKLARGQWHDVRRYFLTGSVAALLCVGLTAIQILPLLELIQYSVRKDSIELLGSASHWSFLKGLLIGLKESRQLGLEVGNIGLGSSLVVSATLMGLMFRFDVVVHAVRLFDKL
jgi:hypothetical protein